MMLFLNITIHAQTTGNGTPTPAVTGASATPTPVDDAKAMAAKIEKIQTDLKKAGIPPEDNKKETTEKVMCKLPGYVSANLHISDDKKTVTNYTQWATLQDFQNMLKNEEAQKHMKIAGSVATEFKPITYNSIWTHSKND